MSTGGGRSVSSGSAAISRGRLVPRPGAPAWRERRRRRGGPGGGLGVVVVDVLLDGQRLLAVPDRLYVAAELDRQPGDAVERGGFAERVAGGAEQGQCPSGLGERACQAPELRVGFRELVV